MKIKLVLMALAVVLFAFAPSDPPEPQVYLPLVCKSGYDITVAVCPSIKVVETHMTAGRVPAGNIAHIGFDPIGADLCVDDVKVYNTDYEEPFEYINWQTQWAISEEGDVTAYSVSVWFNVVPPDVIVEEEGTFPMRFELHFKNGCTATASAEVFSDPYHQWFFYFPPFIHCYPYY